MASEAPAICVPKDLFQSNQLIASERSETATLQMAPELQASSSEALPSEQPTSEPDKSSSSSSAKRATPDIVSDESEAQYKALKRARKQEKKEKKARKKEKRKSKKKLKEQAAAPSQAAVVPVDDVIELLANDRCGTKVRVRIQSSSTVKQLKELIGQQIGRHPSKIRLQKWHTVFQDSISLIDYDLSHGMSLELYYN